MSRARDNHTRVTNKSKNLIWTVEWIHGDQSRDLRDCRDVTTLSYAYAELLAAKKLPLRQEQKETLSLKRKRDDRAPERTVLGESLEAEETENATVKSMRVLAPSDPISLCSTPTNQRLVAVGEQRAPEEIDNSRTSPAAPLSKFDQESSLPAAESGVPSADPVPDADAPPTSEGLHPLVESVSVQKEDRASRANDRSVGEEGAEAEVSSPRPVMGEVIDTKAEVPPKEETTQVTMPSVMNEPQPEHHSEKDANPAGPAGAAADVFFIDTVPEPPEPHFYLVKPYTSTSRRVLIPLPSSATLAHSLRGQVVLEFPTIQ
ncbi:Box C/D snoRNA accumulation, partial [Cryomyces antarcticus]